MHKLKSAESQANLQKSAILPYFAPEDFLEGRRNSVLFWLFCWTKTSAKTAEKETFIVYVQVVTPRMASLFSLCSNIQGGRKRFCLLGCFLSCQT